MSHCRRRRRRARPLPSQILLAFTLEGIDKVIEACTELSVALTVDEVRTLYGVEAIDTSYALTLAQHEQTVLAIKAAVARGG